MLAEQRKKVVYSNPRGLLWANDKQKYGQRLMESMGWQEGKGLGKDESGTTDNVKASFKFDNNGLGFKAKANSWIEDNNVYEQILADLAKCHNSGNLDSTKSDQINCDSKRSNMEHKTKTSSRLHYHKIIKAKNLSGKSKKDLFCIFPTLKNVNKFETTTKEEKTKTVSDLPQEENVNRGTTNKFQVSESKLSVEEYFKIKMKSKLKCIQPNSDKEVIEECTKDPLPKRKKCKNKRKRIDDV